MARTRPSKYTRRSESYAIAAMPAEVREKLERFAEQAGAEIDLAAPQAAVRTANEPVSAGGFLRRPATPSETLALITDSHLVIVVLRAGEQTNSIYRLDAIDVSDRDSVLIADVGLEINGRMVGGTEPHLAYLPVDEGPAGTDFRARLKEAARPAAR
jgi:hypothetical protein